MGKKSLKTGLSPQRCVNEPFLLMPFEYPPGVCVYETFPFNFQLKSAHACVWVDELT